jgi:hypothetical protein
MTNETFAFLADLPRPSIAFETSRRTDNKTTLAPDLTGRSHRSQPPSMPGLSRGVVAATLSQQLLEAEQTHAPLVLADCDELEAGLLMQADESTADSSESSYASEDYISDGDDSPHSSDEDYSDAPLDPEPDDFRCWTCTRRNRICFSDDANGCGCDDCTDMCWAGSHTVSRSVKVKQQSDVGFDQDLCPGASSICTACEVLRRGQRRRLARHMAHTLRSKMPLPSFVRIKFGQEPSCLNENRQYVVFSGYGLADGFVDMDWLAPYQEHCFLTYPFTCIPDEVNRASLTIPPGSVEAVLALPFIKQHEQRMQRDKSGHLRLDVSIDWAIVKQACGSLWRRARAKLRARALCFYWLGLVHSGKYLGKRVRESWHGVVDLLEPAATGARKVQRRTAHVRLSPVAVGVLADFIAAEAAEAVARAPHAHADLPPAPQTPVLLEARRQ